MIKELFNEMAYHVPKKSLDGYSARQRVIANNIANVNTPGFKAGKIEFEEEIDKAISSGNIQEVDNVTPEYSLDEDQSIVRPDGNNVNLEQEMAELRSTTFAYKTYLKLIKWRYELLKNVMTKSK